jgi:hypothetical protein
MKSLEWLVAQYEQTSSAMVESTLYSKISFQNSAPMVARISKPQFDNASDLKPRRGPAEMLSEVYTLDYVSQHTTIPVPRVFDYNVDANNPLGAPYILMEEVQGHYVEYLPRIPKHHIRHVYGQIADIVLQLSKLQFPRFSLLQGIEGNSKAHIAGAVFEDYHRVKAFRSASDYYTARAQHFLDQK